MNVNGVGNAIQRLIRRNVVRQCGQLWKDTAWLGVSLLFVGMGVAALRDTAPLAHVAEGAGAEARLARSEAEAAEHEAGLAQREGDLGGCLNSFTVDTQVATADGETPIGASKAGDHVLAYDQQTGATASFTVTAALIHTDPVQIHLTIAGAEAADTQLKRCCYAVG